MTGLYKGSRRPRDALRQRVAHVATLDLHMHRHMVLAPFDLKDLTVVILANFGSQPWALRLYQSLPRLIDCFLCDPIRLARMDESNHS